MTECALTCQKVKVMQWNQISCSNDLNLLNYICFMSNGLQFIYSYKKYLFFWESYNIPTFKESLTFKKKLEVNFIKFYWKIWENAYSFL